MALKTPEEFEESLKELKPRVFMNGRKVENILENRNTRTVVEANKASYAWALDPNHKEIMSCYSPLVKEQVNRYTYVSRSREDLVKKAEAGTFTAENLGTCIYRCVGYDAFHSLASTTWEMDRDLGTAYHPRFMDYLQMVQKKDLSVAGALTEPRGSRNKKTLDWPDPYLSLKVVEKNKEGIVVRGAKINISGAYASHELVVLPQSAHSQGEEDYAIAFAVPSDTKGITYVCQYTPYSAERDMADDLQELGNPLFGQRETSMVIFDHVFVPWERVFHCGEHRYSAKLVTRFAKTHRMTCGGTCKVGFMNQIIGAAKLNICNAFWRAMALAGDIGGGLVVTMPSLKELTAMGSAGMAEVQVGIEALSICLLRKINKGTTVIENLEMMRNCEASDMPTLLANLITQFPGSDEKDVEETRR